VPAATVPPVAAVTTVGAVVGLTTVLCTLSIVAVARTALLLGTRMT
jgi:hypothetical protein